MHQEFGWPHRLLGLLVPSGNDLRQFWEEKIWGNADKYAGQAEWLEELRKNYRSVEEQVWTGISVNDVSAQLAKSMNWKAPGIN